MNKMSETLQSFNTDYLVVTNNLTLTHVIHSKTLFAHVCASVYEGILCNGDVVGCTSIRRPEYVEGNLRHQTLAEIWNSPDAFLWRRKIQLSDLGSKCQQCRYVASCLGGCTNIRLTTGGKFNSDNPLCVYANCSSFNKQLL